MATDRKRCHRCGSNYRPECKGCCWNVADINARSVNASIKASHDYAQSQQPHRRNQVIAYAARTYNDAMFDEGTPCS